MKPIVEVTIEVHNTIYDAAAINQLRLTGSDEEISEDLERICQLVSSMSLKGLQKKVEVHQSSSVLGARELRHALESMSKKSELIILQVFWSLM